MTIQQAVSKRIAELAELHQLSINALADMSGISPSTLKRTVKPYATTKASTISTIKKVTEGLNMTFREFWDSSLFDGLEDEPDRKR